MSELNGPLTDDESANQWWFYLVRCSDNSLYSGIAVDTDRRVDVHNSGKGARYTRSRRPVTLVYREPHPDRSTALKREAEVKKWTRSKKEHLARGFQQTHSAE